VKLCSADKIKGGNVSGRASGGEKDPKNAGMGANRGKDESQGEVIHQGATRSNKVMANDIWGGGGEGGRIKTILYLGIKARGKLQQPFHKD